MKIEGSLLVVVVCPVLAIIQDPSANTIVFLQKLKEDLQKFTNMDLDSYEGQVILKDKFLSQCTSDIRIKLQQLQQQGPSASLDEMVQTASHTFYNREQEKPRPKKGRKEKRQGMLRCCLPSGKALSQTPTP